MIDQIIDELIGLLSQKIGQEFLRSETEGETLMSLSQNQMSEATILCQDIEEHFGIEPLARWGAMNILEIAKQIVKEKGE